MKILKTFFFGLVMLGLLIVITILTQAQTIVTPQPGITPTGILTPACLTFPSGSQLCETNSGTLEILGTTPMLQFGGTSSSFPALKRNAAAINLRLADDSGDANETTAQLVASSSVFITGTASGLGVSSISIINSTPTISSGFGSSPSIISSNKSFTFRVNVGTGGAATSGVIGMPTATTGWNCAVNDITTPADVTRVTSSTTNTVTFTTTIAWTASDTLMAICAGF